MKKRRQKFMSLLLAGMMSISAILTGCSNNAQDIQGSVALNSGNTNIQSSVPSSAQDSADAPEDNKLVVALQTDALVTDYEDNALTHYFEETLGIDLELQLLPASADEVRTKISLMVTSGEELPDVLITGALSDAMILQYGMDGIFLPVQDYVLDASAMPNYNSIAEEDRNAMNISATMADGNMYSFGRYEDAVWNTTPYRNWINQAWLDKLGLSVPETTEELKEVLIAFRDKDPNGNGQKDEIPLYGTLKGLTSPIISLMNSFVYWSPARNGGLILDESGQSVTAPFISDAWQQGLLYMKDLYNEGLLSPDCFIVDNTQFKATVNAETNIVGMVVSNSIGTWADADNNANYKEMAMMSPLAGPDGVRYTPYHPTSATQCMFIFSDSDKVDLAVKFADEHYNEYSARIIRYGQEGIHWTTDPEVLEDLTNAFVEMGYFEKITMGIIHNMWNENGNYIWRNVGPRYMSRETASTWVEIKEGKEYNPYSQYNMNGWNLKYYGGKYPEYILPALKYTSEETEQILDTLTNIPDYVMQSMAEFITGTKDIENDWDEYLSTLENMGLSIWLSTAQISYDRTQE